MSKENFKAFVKKNTSLVDYVKSGQMTWQGFYEIYDLYGENNEVWEKYRNVPKVATSNVGIMDAIKGLDTDTVRSGISSLEKAVLLVRDILIKNDSTATETKTSSTYTPRPMYKYFED